MPEDNDKTMVVNSPLRERTMVMSAVAGEKKQSADIAVNQTAKEKKSSPPRKIWLKRFFRPRLTVDDLLEIELPMTNKAAGIIGARPEQCHLSDLNEHYVMALKPFANGGQGSVCKAEDLALGCEVVIKSLHEDLQQDKNSRTSFLREAQLTASLDHPYIVPIHGLFGDKNDGIHLSMKMIHGCTMRHYLDKIIERYEQGGIKKFNERKSLLRRIDIFLRVCDAVGYAHERNILHCDLKLENIMIGRHHETYLTDWGIARQLDEPPPEKVCGTPGYIAPELLKGSPPDVRSDIYSLGVILFELISLNPAFRDGDLAEILSRVQYGLHEPLIHRCKCKLDADLKAIVLKAMSLEPENRYESVETLADDLQRYIAHEEVTARKDSLFAKFSRWSFNHRRGMAFTIMALLLLALGMLAYNLQDQYHWSIERRYRDHAAATAYSLAMNTANGINSRVQRMEHHLNTLRMHLLFSVLGVQVPDVDTGDLFMDLARYQSDNPPAGWQYSPVYNGNIDLEHICVFNYLKKPLDQNKLAYFSNTGRFMKEMMFEQPLKNNLSGSQNWLRNYGKPARMVYWALTDGLYAAFPANTDYPGDFFPPDRPWYQAALAADGKAVWSAPYYDIGNRKELVMTCSMTVRDAAGSLVGVAAIDFSLAALAGELFNMPGGFSDFTNEKLLINDQGKVIFRMSPPEKPGIAMPDDGKLIRQMLAMRHGSLTTNINGKEQLLVFVLLPTVNLLYVELLDMEHLVDYVRSREQ